ncbi:LPS translocon maturation chaperone LptM [Caballeronia ptereochthonis]|uniref:Lipoprotein n=1 Tax=Caballeronia ptereochthonis TaxID=1777144 RepID=A0A158DVC7_9BURK|nr:lipoprotein [Caballeronia ptereochthonis]SAK98572.1 putative lipoprotein [Caballeronia ptereochthonis]
MRVVFRMSAIVAALSLGAAATLTLGGCGQRGPLYLPTVPPLPQRPNDLQNTPPSDVTPSDETALRRGTVPDTSGEPLTLSPETDLKSGPNAASAPKAASSAY